MEKRLGAQEGVRMIDAAVLTCALCGGMHLLPFLSFSLTQRNSY